MPTEDDVRAVHEQMGISPRFDEAMKYRALAIALRNTAEARLRRRNGEGQP